MGWNDFLGALKLIDCELKGGAASLLSAVDRLTYSMLVDCLKSQDPDAVKNAIDQLAAEKRPLAIPPLYLVSVAHPLPWVRGQASKALRQLIEPEKLAGLIEGKETGEAVLALIQEFGNYKRA